MLIGMAALAAFYALGLWMLTDFILDGHPELNVETGLPTQVRVACR